MPPSRTPRRRRFLQVLHSICLHRKIKRVRAQSSNISQLKSTCTLLYLRWFFILHNDIGCKTPLRVQVIRQAPGQLNTEDMHVDVRVPCSSGAATYPCPPCEVAYDTLNVTTALPQSVVETRTRLTYTVGSSHSCFGARTHPNCILLERGDGVSVVLVFKPLVTENFEA